MKTCTVCKQTKPFEEYRKYGGRGRDGLRPLCRICQREYEKGWRSRTTEYRRTARQKRSEKDKEYSRQYITDHKAAYLIAQIRRRCAKRGTSFDLDGHISEIQERISKGVCEVSGYPLRMEHGAMAFNSPSIDRIVPAKGYVYENIRIVCFAMNAALGNWGEGPLREVMQAWLNRKE